MIRIVEEEEMKKKVFLCVAVSLMIFESMAKNKENRPFGVQNEEQIASGQKKLGLIDFLKSGSNTQKKVSDAVEVTPKSSVVSEKNNLSSTEVQPVPVDQISVISDKIVDSSPVTEQKQEKNLPQLKISEDNKVDEVFVNSFRGVTNLTDLLKNIQSNVESLSFGRMSNADYNKLIQKKQNISVSKNQYTNSALAYDKICAMERILMNYNSVSEISVHFLSDISKHEINKVQEALFLSEIDSLSDGLTYTFKTQISSNLKNSISNIHEEISGYEIKEFSHKLLREIEKIPSELLDPAQYVKVEKILKDLHKPIVGNFESKCAILKHLVDSYNNLKTIPFRLKKISSDSVKKLALQAIEDIFFEKMLNTLRIMDDEHYSATAENDSEALAALNIKKALCKMLGGISYSGKEYKSNIELFRTTESLSEKQNLLKDSISQFNKAVDLFKIAMTSLKSEGRRPKLRNIDEINTINEDIDKIFEKISIYDKNAKKEDSEDFQRVIIDKSDVVPERVQNQEVQDNSFDSEKRDKELENALPENT